MKKLVLKLGVSFLILSMLTSVLAFAAGPITANKEDSLVTVEVTNLNSNEETTLLVVAKGVTIENALENTEKVFYIDQTSANQSGVATFNFVYEGDSSLDIYSGYSSMNSSSSPYSTVLDLSGSGEGGTTPDTKPYKVGDVNNDGNVDALDSGFIIQHFLCSAPFSFEYGELAGDVNYDGNVDALDSGFIIQHFLCSAPLPTPPAE